MWHSACELPVRGAACQESLAAAGVAEELQRKYIYIHICILYKITDATMTYHLCIFLSWWCPGGHTAGGRRTDGGRRAARRQENSSVQREDGGRTARPQRADGGRPAAGGRLGGGGRAAGGQAVRRCNDATSLTTLCASMIYIYIYIYIYVLTCMYLVLFYPEMLRQYLHHVHLAMQFSCEYIVVFVVAICSPIQSPIMVSIKVGGRPKATSILGGLCGSKYHIII